MSHYQEYKRKARIIDQMSEFLRQSNSRVDTFQIGRFDLTLDKTNGTFRVIDAETGVTAQPQALADYIRDNSREYE